MKEHVHGRHQSLARADLHLLQIAPLGILVHTQDIERDDGFQLDGHFRVERVPELVVVLLAQSLGRLDGRVGNLLVVFDGLEGRLRKVLRIFPSEKLRLVRLVIGIFGARDERENGGNSKSDGGRGFVALVIDPDLVLQTRYGLVHGNRGGWRQDRQERMDEDVVGLQSGGMGQSPGLASMRHGRGAFQAHIAASLW